MNKKELLEGNKELQNLSTDDVMFADIEICFGVETLHDSYHGCSIKLEKDSEPLYEGVSTIDFLLDIINKIKDFIPKTYIIEKKADEDYGIDEDPDFQFISVILHESFSSKSFLLIPAIYIKSIDSWLEIHNNLLKEEAGKTISIK